MQRLQIFVQGHFSSHDALSSKGHFAPFALWRLSVFLRPLARALGSFPYSGAPWSFTIAPIFRKRMGSNNNNKAIQLMSKYGKTTTYMLYTFSSDEILPTKRGYNLAIYTNSSTKRFFLDLVVI